MGNPLSPIIANIFMSHFEIDLTESNSLPRIWYHYVDDIFSVMKKAVFDLLNSQYQTIKFTFEEEQHEKLPFLDVCIER
jgi:hypothetical protein